MPKVIQARLDPPTEKALDYLREALDWHDSQIVREALKLLAGSTLREKKRPFIGVGKFESGVKDLATNKRHMQGFGK